MSERGAAAALVLLLLATACGPVEEHPGSGNPLEDAPGPTLSPPPADETGSPEPGKDERPIGNAAEPEDATEYMMALARFDDPEAMRRGTALAVEDSAAHLYLRHFAQVAAALDEAGEIPDAASVEPDADGFEVCPAEPAPGTCARFTDFTTEEGLVTGFRIDDIDPGERLVSAQDTTAGSAGVEARLITAYRSITRDDLVVTAEFTTTDDADLDLPGASYTTTDGERRRASEAIGDHHLEGGRTTQTMLAFPAGTPLGGRLAVGGCLAECSSRVDLEIPVG
ncbi:hypothetical protein [Nocardiopsis sp. LDBS1602]|uniref:hypothetical protein n=1 Tax=Nocardiopsis sp. LDBS1602 TaxID=3109597 RepID=UPI002DBE6800|nr:hypothetical protein [Nocardiopsis sp. LDBS1602]MEC3895717.1 hypothetical protein [Nocardiopsis sp. LDBS1602]